MARFARVVAVDVPHHVTQRGNRQQFILDCDADRLVYLDLLRHYAALHRLSIAGYCLMSNHVHLVVVPHDAEGLALAFKQPHGRYAAFWNARHCSSGHVWQGRFYSCPLDEGHLWRALRYAELNPVRAQLVANASSWPWSSAAAHCGVGQCDPVLDMNLFGHRWSADEWRCFLAQASDEGELAELRRWTHTGRPLGDLAFVQALERQSGRALLPRHGGRPAQRVGSPTLAAR